MRTLFFCLFLSLLPAIAFGQDCSSTCPNITCPDSATPVCTLSGYWVCPCTVNGDDTCYDYTDCNGEGYSCLDGCCVNSVGFETGACLSAYDCGTNPNDWLCPDGCCEWRCNVGGPCGSCGTGTVQQMCNCSDTSGSSCGSCGTTQCDGSCDDPCASSDTGTSTGGGDDGCDPDSDSCGCCTDGYDCEYAPVDTWMGWMPEYACVPEAEDPVIIDPNGDAFALTNVQNGVKFDFFANHKPVQTSWTAPGTDAGWLALDLNGNGKIDNGLEMFSNVTLQPGKAATHLGFKALALYDLPANGGNGDGWIDAKDKVFSRLRLWVDKNHDGISEPGELFTMQQAGITAISLSYGPMKWTDAYGNQFINRTMIVRAQGPGVGQGQWAYDVILAYAK